MNLFAEAQQSDVHDIQQDSTAEGIHLGAMAGTVDLVQRVSTGTEVKNNVLWINPELPQEIGRLDMRIRYQEHSLDSRLTNDSLTVRGRDRGAPPIALCINDTIKTFMSGTTRVFPIMEKSIISIGLKQESALEREKER